MNRTPRVAPAGAPGYRAMAGHSPGRLIWSGAAAGIAYTTVVVIGGFATPGYSHIGEHVSSLYETGAPHGTAIASSFLVYNALLIVFGIAVWHLVSTPGGSRRRLGMMGALAVVLTGIMGAFDDFFPQDPIGEAATTTGSLHIAFAGLASLFTIVAIGLLAAWALGRAQTRPFGWYSLVTLSVIVVFGPVTIVATVNLWSTMGLLERIPIFGFVQWAVVAAVVLARYRPETRLLPG